MRPGDDSPSRSSPVTLERELLPRPIRLVRSFQTGTACAEPNRWPIYAGGFARWVCGGSTAATDGASLNLQECPTIAKPPAETSRKQDSALPARVVFSKFPRHSEREHRHRLCTCENTSCGLLPRFAGFAGTCQFIRRNTYALVSQTELYRAHGLQRILEFCEGMVV